ncbi:mitogen-activated protein kinase kinase kinase [Mycoemilia scoparia]|uniref:Mitogen-activated protein kinase kinase kinase n=1 Tax=Mycoemilia scoparia TaxID=417184 RepID=A0A9W8DTT4_9FUNG|nr:mitogen-activated protein kinase kinase kinase [Mycoemilia scoparia]
MFQGITPTAFCNLTIRDLERMDIPNTKPSDHTRLIKAIRQLSFYSEGILFSSLDQGSGQPKYTINNLSNISKLSTIKDEPHTTTATDNSTPLSLQPPFSSTSSKRNSDVSSKPNSVISDQHVAGQKSNQGNSLEQPNLSLDTTSLPSNVGNTKASSKTTTPTCSESSRGYGSDQNRLNTRHSRARSKGRPGSFANAGCDGSEIGLAPIDTGYRSFNSSHVDKDEQRLLRPDGVATPTSARPSSTHRSYRNSAHADRDSLSSIRNSPIQLSSPSLWLQNGSPNYLHISTGGTLSHNAMPLLGPYHQSSATSSTNDASIRNQYQPRGSHDSTHPSSLSSKAQYQSNQQHIQSGEGFTAKTLSINTNLIHKNQTRRISATIPSATPTNSRPSAKSIFEPTFESNINSASLSFVLDDKSSVKSSRSKAGPDDGDKDQHQKESGPSKEPSSENLKPQPSRAKTAHGWGSGNEIASRTRLPKGYTNFKKGKPMTAIPVLPKNNRYRAPPEVRSKTSIASFINAKRSINAKLNETNGQSDTGSTSSMKRHIYGRNIKPKSTNARIGAYTDMSPGSQSLFAGSSTDVSRTPAPQDEIIPPVPEIKRPSTSAAVLTTQSNSGSLPDHSIPEMPSPPLLKTLAPKKALPPIPLKSKPSADMKSLEERPAPSLKDNIPSQQINIYNFKGYTSPKDKARHKFPQVSEDSPLEPDDPEKHNGNKGPKRGFGAIMDKIANLRSRSRSNSNPKKFNPVETSPLAKNNAKMDSVVEDIEPQMKAHAPLLPLQTYHQPEVSQKQESLKAEELKGISLVSPTLFKEEDLPYQQSRNSKVSTNTEATGWTSTMTDEHESASSDSDSENHDGSSSSTNTNSTNNSDDDDDNESGDANLDYDGPRRKFDSYMQPLPSSDMIKLRHQSFKDNIANNSKDEEDGSDIENEDSYGSDSSSDKEQDKDYLLDYTSLNQDLYQRLKHQDPPSEEDDGEDDADSVSPFPSMTSGPPSLDELQPRTYNSLDMSNISTTSLNNLSPNFSLFGSGLDIGKEFNTSLPSIIGGEIERKESVNNATKARVRFNLENRLQEEDTDSDYSSDDSSIKKHKDSKVSLAEFMKHADHIYEQQMIYREKANAQNKGKKIARLYPQKTRKSSFSKLASNPTTSMKVSKSAPTQSGTSKSKAQSSSTFKIIDFRYLGYGKHGENDQNVTKGSTSGNTGTSSPHTISGSANLGFPTGQRKNSHPFVDYSSLKGSPKGSAEELSQTSNSGNKGDDVLQSMSSAGSVKESSISPNPQNATKSGSNTWSSGSGKKSHPGITIKTDFSTNDKSLPTSFSKTRRPSDPNHRSEGLHISSMRRAPLRRPAISRRQGNHSYKYPSPRYNGPLSSTSQDDEREWMAHEKLDSKHLGSVSSLHSSAEKNHDDGDDNIVGSYHERSNGGEAGSGTLPHNYGEWSDQRVSDKKIQVYLEGENEPHIINISGALTGAGIYDKISRALNINARSPKVTIAVCEDKAPLRRILTDEELLMRCIHAASGRAIYFVIHGATPQDSNITLTSANPLTASDNDLVEITKENTRPSVAESVQEPLNSPEIIKNSQPTSDSSEPTHPGLYVDTSFFAKINSGPKTTSSSVVDSQLASVEIIRSPLKWDFSFSPIATAPLTDIKYTSTQQSSTKPKNSDQENIAVASDNKQLENNVSDEKADNDFNDHETQKRERSGTESSGSVSESSAPEKIVIELSALASATEIEEGNTDLNNYTIAGGYQSDTSRAEKDTQVEAQTLLNNPDVSSQNDISGSTSAVETPIPNKPQIRRTWTLMLLNKEITFSEDEEEIEDEVEDEESGDNKENNAQKDTEEASEPKVRQRLPSVRFEDKLEEAQKLDNPDDSDLSDSSDGSGGLIRKVSVYRQPDFVFDAPEIEGTIGSTSSSDDDDSSIDMAMNRQRNSTEGWKFMPGTRAASLRRKPTKTVPSRPTTDLIADNLDDYFPDHDLDRPIVQSVRVPADLISLSGISEKEASIFSNDEINVVLDEDESRMTPGQYPPENHQQNGKPDNINTMSQNSVAAPSTEQAETLKEDENKPLPQVPHNSTGFWNTDNPDKSNTKNFDFIPISRRKSLRMLMRESRILGPSRQQANELPPSARYQPKAQPQRPSHSSISTQQPRDRVPLPPPPPPIVTRLNRSLEERSAANVGRRLGVIMSAVPKDVKAIITPTSSESSYNYTSTGSPGNLVIPPIPPPASGNWSSTNDSWGPPDIKEPKTPTFLRRRSTKMWGGIPEEIRPKRRGIARIANASAAANPKPPPYGNGVSQDMHIVANDQGGTQQGVNHERISTASDLTTEQDIIRRALSLLQRPDHSPQDEQRIIDSAIKQGFQYSTTGTRKQFTEQQAIWDTGKGRHMRSDSLSSTAQALFSLYGPPSAPIKIQWLKGRQIGKGSFGQVFIALNVTNRELIAVKQIKVPSLGSIKSKTRKRNKDRIQKLYAEIELLKDFEHENIVQYLGFDITKSTMNIFLEYVSGGTVSSLTQQYGPLAEPVVHSFLQQILAGLEYLHSHNILHRDIKGANILVNEQGVCKISDFGISKKAHDDKQAYDRNTRASGVLRGSLYWMAPEVLSRDGYSAKVDVWSVGCMTIEMWTGKHPWPKYESLNIIYHLSHKHAPPLPSDLTKDGLDFCHCCLQAEPDDRWTATQLRNHTFAQTPKDYRFNDYYYTSD